MLGFILKNGMLKRLRECQADCDLLRKGELDDLVDFAPEEIQQSGTITKPCPWEVKGEIKVSIRIGRSGFGSDAEETRTPYCEETECPHHRRSETI
jgi:hypothetical protein